MISLFWYRRDLRLEDNRGLYNALCGEHPVLPIFIFDKNILNNLENPEDARITFIYRQIAKIHEVLNKMSTSILVRFGDPCEVFEAVTEQYKVSAVYTNHDYEPYAKDRDEKVASLLMHKGISFHTFKDQVIFERDDILSGNGTYYKVFTPYKNAWMDKLSSKDYAPYPSAVNADRFYKTEPLDLPTLSDLGFVESTLSIPPLKLEEDLIHAYDRTRDHPYLNTSRIGLHLRFGTISIRKVVGLATKLNNVWLEELIWREFFMMILFHNPHVVENPYKQKYDKIVWRNSEEEFRKWCEGRTGYPIVDAGMRELNATGFMHNRVRMITASFLTKHLLIDWRWGEAYFAEKLLDYELSSNNGNWQWVAGTGADAQPYFRVFNPTSQMERFDKEGEYTERWVPEWGSDKYPEPMVPHKEARERAIRAFKEVLF